MKSRTRKSLLLSFVISIACCGAVGIYCLLIGNLGSIEARILGTASVAGAASILTMAGAVPWERRRWHPLGPTAVLGTATAMVLVIIAIWMEPRNDLFWKVLGVACVLGVTLPHVGLLSLARLRRQYGWLRRLSVVLITLLGGSITYIILDPPAFYDERIWLRVIGILSIGVVCGTIAVPIMHRVSAIRTREDVKTVELMMTLTCPRCQTSQELPAGRSGCGQCGLKFNIQIEEEQCGTCGYPLYQLVSAECPECGTPIANRPES